MTATYTPIKTAPTTVPDDTFVEVTHSLRDGVLLYRPDQNAFIALYPDEWLVMRAEAHQNMTAIDELQAANRSATEKTLALDTLLRQPNAARADIEKARLALDTALDQVAKKSEAAKSRVEAIADQAVDADKLVELVPLTMRQIKKNREPDFVRARRLRAAAADRRIYLVDGPAERARPPSEKLFSGGTINQAELRRRLAGGVQDQAKFEKKWKLAPEDADNFSGILTDWAKVMGTSATAFLERSQKDVLTGILRADQLNPNDPHRHIDLRSEAQFMRWTAGAGAEAVFMPFQGKLTDPSDRTWGQKIKRAAKTAQFSIKANAEASFAIGEAKVVTTAYFPHAAGWHLHPVLGGKPFDLGFFRLRADLTLSAMAGASIALEASAALMVTGNRQGLVGSGNKYSATAKVGTTGEAKVFAGLKENIELAGAIQWLNPEGLVDMHAPKKADPNKAIAEYVDVGSVRCEASLIQGLAGTMGFECHYRGGNFVIAAKAGLCLGLGGSGSVAGKVGAEHIGHFFMCLAHQLKQVDYKKMPLLITEAAYKAYSLIFYLIVAASHQLVDFIGVSVKDIEDVYKNAINSMRQRGSHAIKDLYKSMEKYGWGNYAYMPPESRGAVLATVAEIANEPANLRDENLRGEAAFVMNELLSTTQSTGDFYNTIDRVTVAMGSEPGRYAGSKLIESVLQNTSFSNCLNRCEVKLASVVSLRGRPFMRNDLPEIYLAQFPLHHPAYPIA